MHVLAKLFTLYDEVRDNIDKAIGRVFNYDNLEDNGLKLIAEIVFRARRRGLASIFIYDGVIASLCASTGIDLLQGFGIASKIDKLQEKGYFLLCLQHNVALTFNKYLIIKIDTVGEHIQIYAVSDKDTLTRHITDLRFEYDDDILDDIDRLYGILLEESRRLSEKT